MLLPNLSPNFDIARRFPVLRGARSAASVSSGVASTSATGTLNNCISSETDQAQAVDFQPNFRNQKVQHPSSSPDIVALRGDVLGDRLRTPARARQSFDGVPEQLLYGLFEKPKKNFRYVEPRHWSPTNSSQVM
jgi:hypothetical protein